MITVIKQNKNYTKGKLDVLVKNRCLPILLRKLNSLLHSTLDFIPMLSTKFHLNATIPLGGVV